MSDRRWPLQWPLGWARAKRRTRSAFKVTESKSLSDLNAALRRLGARDALISTNVPLRRDGMPYANTPKIDDPGVAVYWTDPKTKLSRVIACDRWEYVWENMRAIYLALEAIRSIERSGASEILDRAYAGFAALPAPETARPHRPWWEVFGLPYSKVTIVTGDALKSSYRKLASETHPDSGGSHEAFVELGRAFEEAKKELGL